MTNHDWISAGTVEALRQFSSLREKSEALFGPRVEGWDFVGFRFTPNGPGIYFPEGFNGNQIVIKITPETLQDPDRCLFQFAHVTVHLLAPGPPPGSLFEEGAAVWFSLHGPDYSPGYRDIAIRHVLETPDNYRDALEAYEELIAIEPGAVKRLRKVEPYFHKMTPAFIVSQIPEVPAGLAARLCERRTMR